MKNGSVPVTRIVFVGDSTVYSLFHGLLHLSEGFEDLKVDGNFPKDVIVKSDARSLSLEFHELEKFDFQIIDDSTVIIGAGVEWLVVGNEDFQNIKPKKRRIFEKMSESKDKTPVGTIRRRPIAYPYYTKYLIKMEKLKQKLDKVSADKNVFWYLGQEDSTDTLSRKAMEVMNDIARNIIIKTRVIQPLITPT